MTVPVVGASSRKSGCRYLPEIHASRFSVSGSLRPKLGLLILLVLLVLGLILLVVPLATRLHAAGTVGGHATALSPPVVPARVPLSHRWAEHMLRHLLAAGSGNSSKNIACSPLGLLASVKALAGWPTAGLSTASLLAGAVAEEQDLKAVLSPPPQSNASLWWIHKLFVQNGPQIRADFVAHLTALGLSVEHVEVNANSAAFEEKLSSWLRAVSGGRFQQLNPEGVIHSPAELVLVGAYHASVQLSGFRRIAATQQQAMFQPFGTSSSSSSHPVNFMARVGPAGIATFEATGVTGVELELANTRHHVLVCILPPAGAVVADLEALLGQLETGGYLSREHYHRRSVVSVHLPVWQHEQTVDLLPVLSALGLPEALVAAGGKNLSLHGIAGNAELRLTDLRQSTKIDLLEDDRNEGRRSEEEPPADVPQVTFDRPFLYSLVQRDTGEILLAGIVRDLLPV